MQTLPNQEQQDTQNQTPKDPCQEFGYSGFDGYAVG